jgi:hypothetical protein
MRILKKYAARVQEIFKDEDGWWIYLNRGWYWDDKGLHTIHEDTQREALEQLRYTDPCDCDYCRGLED